MKYVNVLGGSNSGKSTFSKRLADKLGATYVELDAINWQPNWQMDSDEVFIGKVDNALADSNNGWVVDGSYSGRLGSLVHNKADTIIFLSVPLYVTLPRQFRRTYKRVIKREKLWNGNQESLKNSLLLTYWIIKSQRTRKKRMLKQGPELGKAGKQYIVFKSNKKADAWLEEA